MEDQDNTPSDEAVLNNDYADLDGVEVALESLDLHQQALTMIEKQEDKIENPEWLRVTSKLDSFTDDFPSMEDSDNPVLYYRIKDRIIKLLSWLSGIISRSLSSLSDYAKSFNIKADMLALRLNRLDPNKFVTANKFIPQSLVPLVSSTGKIMPAIAIREIQLKFLNESFETFSVMEGSLVNYKDRLNLYLRGSYPEVPKIDLFDTLRRTSNFKGSDERITSELTDIGYRVTLDKGEYGAVKASFFLPDIRDSAKLVELPNPNQMILLFKANSNLLKVANKYAKDIYLANSRFNRITSEIMAVVNSKSPEDETFQEASLNLVRSRDFNQIALFSSIKTFIQITRYNLKVLNQVCLEILRMSETASRKQEKMGGVVT